MSFLHRWLKIDARAVEFARRGFTCSDPRIQARLERIGQVFLRGYHSALEEKDQHALAARLDQVEPEDRGFAYEGAAMALALLDQLRWRGNALPRFIAGAGHRHVFMLHVGAGWAYARLPWRRRRMEAALAGLDPVLRWLAVDGFGFHEGYFHARSHSRIVRSTARLSPEARRIFYQGLGRSLWFSRGADVPAISRGIACLPRLYQEDAWSGVGLACAYAGGVPAETIVELRRESGACLPALAQGAAFAAKARRLAGNPAAHTDLACAALCGMPAAEAAALCDLTFRQLDPQGPCPYQHWRRLLNSLFSSSQFSSRGASNEYNVSTLLAATKPH